MSSARTARARTWALIGIALVAAGIVAAVLAGRAAWTGRDAFDPDSAGPAGTRALAQVLREHGVQVDVVRSGDDLDAALAGPDAVTLVLPDSPLLSDATLRTLSARARTVVVPDAQARAARVLFDSTASGWGTGDAVEPDCTLAAAGRAGAIVPGAMYAADAAAGTTACYRDGDAAALLSRDEDGRRVTIVDGTTLFANDALAHGGNAALAVNLLGAHPRVIWYVPGAADADTGAGAATLGELTPPWVSPAIAVLLAAGIAAALWRGRRFGPLVTERLPVSVRGLETTDGRARLYARSRDLDHVAAALRRGARARLARMLSLGPAASVAVVADAAADRLALPRARIRGILADDPVRSERELLALSDALARLEAELHRALRPATAPPTAPEEDRP